MGEEGSRRKGLGRQRERQREREVWWKGKKGA